MNLQGESYQIQKLGNPENLSGYSPNIIIFYLDE